MRRFERFMASQFIWVITIAILFMNLDSIRFLDNEILIFGGALSIAIMINLGIWFGEGIARAFDDDIYDKLSVETATVEATTEDVEKRNVSASTAYSVI